MALHDGERVVFSPGELLRPVEDLTKLEHLTRYRLVRDRLVPGCTVLDLGCGVGYGAMILQERASLVYALDCDAETLAYARAYFGSDKIQYHAAEAGTAVLPLVDAAVAFESLEHVPDPGETVTRLAGALPPHGLLAVSSPILPTKHYNPWHRWNWTAEEFEALFEADFVIEERVLQNGLYLVLFARRRVAREVLGAHVSEADKCRERLAPYCEGVGVDLGFGGSLLVPHATGIDRRLFQHVDGTIGGDALHDSVLGRFEPGTLDFVAAVHFLEQMEDPIKALIVWTDRLRPGGRWVLNLPHRLLHREHSAEQVWNPDPELVGRWFEETGRRTGRTPSVVHQFIDGRLGCHSFDLVVSMDQAT